MINSVRDQVDKRNNPPLDRIFQAEIEPEIGNWSLPEEFDTRLPVEGLFIRVMLIHQQTRRKLN